MTQIVRSAAGAGALAVQRVVALARGKGGPAGSGDTGPARWHAVTVFKDRDEVAPLGELPAPLAELGDAVEVRLRDAPGGRGTEIHVRPTGDLSGDALQQRTRQLRSALRRSKQILETGEVLNPDRPGSTKPTPLNAALRYATGHGLEEGRL